MSPRLGRIVRLLVLGVMLVALVLFAFTIDWKETWAAMRTASPALLLIATLVNLCSFALKSVAWWIFLRPIGVGSLWLALKATLAGAALNNLLVANSGEAARVIFIARASHVSSARILATVAMQRLFELLAYGILLAAALTLLELPSQLQPPRPVAFAGLFGVAAVMIYLLRHPERADVTPLTGEGLLHRVRSYGRRFASTMRGISEPRRFAVSLAVAGGVWATQVLTYHLTADAAGFPISWSGTVAAVLAVNLSFVVRATPGNLGVFQLIYAITAAAFGLDRNQAIAVGLLIQAQQLIPVTVLGFLVAPEILRERRRATPRESNVLPGEPVPESPRA